MSRVLEHVVRYAAPSRVVRSPGRSELRLSSDTNVCDRAAVRLRFDGAFARPGLAARMLRSVGLVVRSHFSRSPDDGATVLDPVLTTGDGWLRVEGFSGCAGVYARADFGPASHGGAVRARGTTNVDFGVDTMAALAAVRSSDELRLRVGSDVVEVAHGERAAVEHKVPLPLRWLRSFVAVQEVQADLPLRFEVDAVTACASFARFRARRRGGPRG